MIRKAAFSLVPLWPGLVLCASSKKAYDALRTAFYGAPDPIRRQTDHFRNRRGVTVAPPLALSKKTPWKYINS